MTPKHYSPRASLELFDGNRVGVLKKISDRESELKSLGKRVGIISYETNLDKSASTLFAVMRMFDLQKIDTILCALPPAEGIGLAIRDRLFRAAGTEGSRS